MAKVRIVCGAYERVLCGLDAVQDERSGVWLLSPVFIVPAHSGCIKALDIGGHLLASGSTDEVIKLFDLHRRVELGSLLQHDGSITDLAFYGTSHLLSASEDGTLCIWRTSDWECLKTLKGHKGPVHAIAVHPSGKLALSTGKDRALHTWDLVQGRSAHLQRLPVAGDVVRWAPGGTSFAVVHDSTVDVYSAAVRWRGLAAQRLMPHANARQTATVVHTVQSSKRVTSFAFATDDTVLIATDEGLLRAHALAADQDMFTLAYHATRIRGLALVKTAKQQLLVTISSDGLVCLWDYAALLRQPGATADDAPAPQPLASYSTDIRLTCLRATVLSKGGKGKRAAETVDAEPEPHVVAAAAPAADTPPAKKRKARKPAQ